MIQQIEGMTPTIHSTARFADNAVLVGNVTLGEEVNIWYGAVLRGDNSSIVIGARTNVQEHVIVHCEPEYSVTVGQGVTVGHGAILHGCTIEDGCLIGMGAILLDGCVIGAGSLVGAGALVTQNTIIPPGSLVVGSPARVLRPLKPEESEDLLHSAENYCKHAAQAFPSAAQRAAGCCQD